MAWTLEHLELLRGEYLKSLPRKEQRFKELGDISVIYEYYLLAVAEFYHTKDPAIFKKRMNQGVSSLIEWMDRFPENKNKSYFDDNCHQYLFWAYASGNETLAIQLWERIRDSKLQGHPFVKWMFRLWTAFFSGENFKGTVDEAVPYFEKRLKSWVGYPLMFDAIFSTDEEKVSAAFQVLMKGHKRLSSTGEWAHSADQILAIWPLGMVNLARMKGIKNDFTHALIPEKLILEKEWAKVCIN